MSCIWVILIRTATHMCQAKVQTFLLFWIEKKPAKKKILRDKCCYKLISNLWWRVRQFLYLYSFFVKVLLKIIGCTEKENKHDKRIGFIRSWVLCTLTRNLWLTLTTIWNFDRHHTYYVPQFKRFLMLVTQTHVGYLLCRQPFPQRFFFKSPWNHVWPNLS